MPEVRSQDHAIDHTASDFRASDLIYGPELTFNRSPDANARDRRQNRQRLSHGRNSPLLIHFHNARNSAGIMIFFVFERTGSMVSGACQPNVAGNRRLDVFDGRCAPIDGVVERARAFEQSACDLARGRPSCKALRRRSSRVSSRGWAQPRRGSRPSAA
jgi:hypothetical protein